MKIIYTPEYFVDIQHTFYFQKYRLLYKKLINEKILKEKNFIKPKLPSQQDLLKVHTKEYLKKLEILAKSPLGMLNSENPINQEILKFAKLTYYGTYLASKLALKEKISINLSGGFHHAFPDHEEGFCYLHDIAFAIKKLQDESLIKKAMVIDCDVHQGNGTAFIFQNNENVFTFSIHQEDNYPIKQKSSYDIGLYSYNNITDKIYLEKLKILPNLIKDFKPNLIIYEAGADPYKEDKLGGFKLTKEGLKQRDKYIINLALKNKIPISIVFGGGYSKLEDVVDIHFNTIKVALDCIKNKRKKC
ncbi:MAG: histone deacetylase [Nanoarchaeota archaeon]|nr:histone deacetylase [Nanoarchaeota archaeon]